MKYLVVAFLMSWALLETVYANETVYQRWEEHMHVEDLTFESLKQHNKKMGIFMKTDALIEHQSHQDLPYELSHNKFSHMTEAEKKGYLGFTPDLKYFQRSRSVPFELSELKKERDTMVFPAEFDLRTHKCMGPVKNQGQTGTCWIFAAINAVEFGHCKKHDMDSYVVLSEQQVVDCCGQNTGCQFTAWTYLEENGGSVTNESYPFTFTPKEGECYVDSAVNVAQIDHSVIIPHDNDTVINMKAALMKYGPVTVGINVIGEIFQIAKGVYTGTACDRADGYANHNVNIVGWGTDAPTGIDYWILRNSWGFTDEDDGYFRLQMGVNKCQVESAMPGYTVVA